MDIDPDTDLNQDLSQDLSQDLNLGLDKDKGKDPDQHASSKQTPVNTAPDFEPMNSAVPELPESERSKAVELYYEREIMVEGDLKNAPFWRVGLAILKALFPGLLRPWILIVSIIGMLFGFFLLQVGLAGVAIFGFGGVHTAVVIGSVGMVLYGQCAAWLIWGEFEHFLSMSFVPTQWLLFAVLWVLPIAITMIGMYMLK